MYSSLWITRFVGQDISAALQYLITMIFYQIFYLCQTAEASVIRILHLALLNWKQLKSFYWLNNNWDTETLTALFSHLIWTEIWFLRTNQDKVWNELNQTSGQPERSFLKELHHICYCCHHQLHQWSICLHLL